METKSTPVFFSLDSIHASQHRDDAVVPSAHWLDAIEAAKAFSRATPRHHFGWIEYSETALVGRWGARPRVRKFVVECAVYRRGRYQGRRPVGTYSTLAKAAAAARRYIAQAEAGNDARPVRAAA